MATLWNWAAQQNYVAGPLPKTGLKFPKLDEQPPFQTYAQIVRQVNHGRLTDAEEAQLGNCLYLAAAEVDELVAVVRKRATYQFLYPMVLMAAHTGARRSELFRSREMDIDFDSGTIIIRESYKKGTSHDRQHSHRQDSPLRPHREHLAQHE